MNTDPERIKSIPELWQNASELFRVKADPLFAVGTDDIVITLEPTERFIELVSAPGAWERELLVSTKD